jgi:energy-coupling factor transport system permease protein
MKGIITGQYITGDSIIHQLDPRTKIIGCFILIFAAAWPHHQIPILLFNIGCIIIFACISQVGTNRLLRGLVSLRMFFLLTFICQVLLTREGLILFSWGAINITNEGILAGVSIFLRLVMLYLAASLLTMTTSPLKLAKGIESLLYPLNYLRVPADKISMIINISLRFVPLVLEQADIIIKAQKSRGACFDSGPLLLRLKNVLAVLIPLLAASLQRAFDLAMAMESRCYTGRSTNNIRTGRLYFTWRDWAAIGAALIVFLLPVILTDILLRVFV